MEVQGTVAIVTRAAGVLGQRISRALAVQGVHIAGVYQQSAEAANALVAEWSALGPRNEAFQADVTEPASVQQMVERVAAAFGRIDILVNNVAYAVSKAALTHLTGCLAVTLGPEVAANALASGLLRGMKMTARLSPEHVERGLKQSALQRYVALDDVADQVVTFCRTDSTTGQVMVIDSGRVSHEAGRVRHGT